MKKTLRIGLRCAVLCLGAVGLSGQGQSQGEGRPSFQFIRSAEDWSNFVGGGPREGFYDAAKHVAMCGGDENWISFGGDLRFRAEAWNGFNFGAPPGIDHDDVYGLGRLRVHADMHLGAVRVFGEVATNLATDRDLLGGTRGLDEDLFNLQQLFVEGDLGPIGILRAGRQQLSFGKQRIISPLPWANTLRSWDGVSAVTRAGAWKISTFGTAFVPVNRLGPNDPDQRRLFFGVYAETRGGPAKESQDTDLYLLRNDWEGTMFNGTFGEDDRWTLGMRQVLRSGDTDLEVELGYQLGNTGSASVSAWSLASVLGHTLNEEVRVWAGFDWASGDRNRGGNVQTFNQLYPLGHAYFGIVDAIGRQNILSPSVGTTWRVSKQVTAKATALAYWVDSTNDAIYDAGANPRRAGGTYRSSHIGYEGDLVVTWKPRPDVAWTGGYGHLFAGDALSESGPSDDLDFLYVGLTLTH